MDVGVDQAGQQGQVFEVDHRRIANIDMARQKLSNFVLANDDRRRAERALTGNRDHRAGMNNKVLHRRRWLRRGGAG
ncbi:hypothetical protein GCM10011393_02840 [Sphingopyxis bauzanensis]|nr:hypothetical protein GCM10011393_02840 [Sphingopyxis bauzanensis]